MSKLITKTEKFDSPLDNLGQKILDWIFKERSYFTKLLPIFCIIFIFDVFENVVSAGTSFAWVHSITMMFMDQT